ncbi:MAG TPA: hypothetical protein VKX17_26950 [Planctomycetota bacterium]|nr:hypothetical protein [Planctomycetota bacterium]
MKITLYDCCCFILYSFGAAAGAAFFSERYGLALGLVLGVPVGIAFVFVLFCVLVGLVHVGVRIFAKNVKAGAQNSEPGEKNDV